MFGYSLREVMLKQKKKVSRETQQQQYVLAYDVEVLMTYLGRQIKALHRQGVKEYVFTTHDFINASIPYASSRWDIMQSAYTQLRKKGYKVKKVEKENLDIEMTIRI